MFDKAMIQALLFWWQIYARVGDAQINISTLLTTLTPLEEPDTWDIMEQGTLHLHVVARWYEVTNPFRQNLNDEFNDTIVYWKTRVYCYSNSSEYYWNDTCGIPGPTIIFHPNNQTQEVVLHNHLIGISDISDTAQDYKNPDVTNIHVHGIHVSPHVDNIVDVEVLPVCPQGVAGSDISCCENCTDSHSYPYVIPTTHYPGSHWYHAHIHGSTTLQVNGGLYGAIRMEPYDGIPNLSMYEPQLINDSYDHTIVASFVWLNSADSCNFLFNGSKGATCGGRQLTDNITPPELEDYVQYQGIFPFNFALESWCWVNCKLNGKYAAQYQASQVQANDVIFSESGEWATSECQNSECRRGFLINGQARPHLAIKTGEWHRLRIVNTNMAYLIWQLSEYVDNANDASSATAISSDVCQQWLISNDGIYFSGGPRLVTEAPYYHSFAIPPGGRADIMLICGEEGAYSVVATNNTQDSVNNLFDNGPVPGFVSRVLTIVASGDSVDIGNKTTCAAWNSDSLPCEFVPYEYAPYLKDTTNTTGVTSACQTVHGPDVGTNGINQCNLVLQASAITAGKVTVNHIAFSGSQPLLNISTGTVHEWLVTSNFHQFHHHTWPFQMQRNVSDGWLAQRGDWRDVVGAPGSFTARVNLVLFNSGKLVTHCHFVPHEDHGLMAWHALIDPSIFNNTPIVPTNADESSIPYQAPNESEYVTNCTSFTALSSIDIFDVDTRIYFFFKQFKENGTCLFGYLPIVIFRPGGTSNAFIGFGLFGSYQDDWQNTMIDGDGLVFTLQAGQGNTTGDPYDLADVYLSEVKLTNYTSSSQSTTPATCSNYSTTFNTTDRQIRAWYCVRPRTIDYPTDGIDVLSHTNESNPFGFAFTYGEGQFYKDTLYSASGTCGMVFTIDTDNDESENIQQELIGNSIKYFRCYQFGTIVGANTGQPVDFNISTINLTGLSINSDAFIRNSGFDTSSLPATTTGDDDDDDETTTTESGPSTTESDTDSVCGLHCGIQVAAMVMTVAVFMAV